MLLDYADECFFYLNEAQNYINKFQDIDMYSAIFEAKNSDVDKKIAENGRANGNAFTALRKAAQSVVNLIANAIKTVIGSIERLFSSKNEKAKFDRIKAIIKEDPSLAKKKVRFYDFKHNTEEWQRIEAAAEEADRMLAAGEDVEVSGILNDIKRYTAGFGKTAIGTVGAQTAINACYGSKEFARSLSNAMARDGAVMQQITETLGEKEAKKFKKEVDSLAKDNKIAKLFGKRINLKRAMNKSRVMQCQTLEDSIKYTMNQIGHDANMAMNASAASKNNDELYASGGVKNFFRRQGNKIKSARYGAPLLADDGVRRGGRILSGNDDAKEGFQKFKGRYDEMHDKAREKNRANAIARREGDYDIADYKRRTDRGDFSAQSLPSFAVGDRNIPILRNFSDKQNIDAQREYDRRAALDYK